MIVTCKTIEGPKYILACSLSLKFHVDFNVERNADSGTLIKTPAGKNLIGAFWQVCQSPTGAQYLTLTSELLAF